MIKWLRSWVEAIWSVIDVWRLMRWYMTLSDAEQEAELARITEIVKEQRNRRQGQS